MTKDQLQEYIQTNVSTLAAGKYANKHDQLYYTVGFLIAQLAEAAYNDSHTLYKFRDTVEHSSKSGAARAKRNI
jgi:hypothetical protein